MTESIGFISGLLMCYCLCCFANQPNQPKQVKMNWAPATAHLAIAFVTMSLLLAATPKERKAVTPWVSRHLWFLAVVFIPQMRPWSLPLCSGCSRNCICLGGS